MIDPLRLAAEAGVLRQADEFVLRIFVGAFRPDGLILFELDRDGSFGDCDLLPGAGAEVHFDTAGFFIEDGEVPELLQVEVSAEFAIDAGKKVEIERGGNTDWVIVSGNQCLNGLEHVGAE